MLKIIISGCNGHMGRVVESLCANDPAVEVCAGFDVLGTSDREFPVYTSPAQFAGQADAVIDFLTFEGTPTFNSTATMNFYGVEEDQIIYEMKNGRLTRSGAKWSEENGSWELKTRTLGSYVISDQALKSPAGNSTDDNNTNNGTGGTGVDNPETGAGDVTGVATALALASLVSAAAVSLKKR